MAEDVLELTERYLSADASRWARLASTIGFRRLQILLLRAILLELRQLNSANADRSGIRDPSLADRTTTC